MPDLQKTEQLVSLLRSGRRYASVAAYRSAPDVERYIQQRQCSGSAATVRARAASRVPVETTGTFAPPVALSVATRVAGAPSEHRRRRRSFIRATPEIAAYRRS